MLVAKIQRVAVNNLSSDQRGQKSGQGDARENQVRQQKVIRGFPFRCGRPPYLPVFPQRLKERKQKYGDVDVVDVQQQARQQP